MIPSKLLATTDCTTSVPRATPDAFFPGVLLRLLVCVLLLWAVSGVLRAQPVLHPEIEGREDIRVPVNLNQLDIYLITVDVGNRVWDNFGHTALRVVDRSTNTDLIFNWGLFDTSVGLVRFAGRFALGQMNYQLGMSPPDWEFARYAQEGRTVWQDRLRLTPQQKRTLYERLAWNIRPENIQYEYDYFFDNCTTRVRDYLDEALNGALSSSTQTLTNRTFRDEVLSHYASVPLIATSLDVLMNERIDQRMSRWQQMFLPLQLRDQLRAQGLVAESEVLMEFTPPPAGPNGYWFAALLLLPTGVLLASVRRASIASFSSQPGMTLRAGGLSYRLLGLVGLIIFAFSGVYGLIMSLGWWLSSHQDIHANINLLLFWPTDILGLGMALNWFVRGRAYTVSSLRAQLITAYVLLHLVAAVVYLVMGLFGLTGQRVGSIMLYMVPLLMLFSVLALTAGMQARRAIRWT